MLDNSVNRWWTVAAGALGNAMGVGIFVVFVLNVLTKPMVADLGLERSVISFSIMCFLITSGIGTVSLGILINRFGVRTPTFIYVAVTAACVAFIPLLPPAPLAFYALFAALGVAGAAATAFPYAVAITGLFDRNRGLALGLAVAGAGAGETFAPQIVNFLLSEVGWRESLWIVAVLMTTPLVSLLLVVRSASPMVVRSSDEASHPASHWSLYLGQRAFWFIAFTLLGVSIGTFGILGVLVATLTDRGVSPSAAAAVLSGAGLSSWGGRILVGWLLDRLWAPLVTSLVCLGAFVGILIVAFGGQSLTLMLLGASLLGLALGSEGDILTYLCGRYFSLQAFSRAVGAMWVVWAWGGGVGTIAAAIAYRVTGSYEGATPFLATSLLLGAGGVLFLGPYVYPPAHARTATKTVAWRSSEAAPKSP